MAEPITRECPEAGAFASQVQLVLAEKRTALAVMRTGIALFALPLSVLSVLVATSRFYTPGHVLHLLVPLLALCLGLLILGGYLIIRSLLRLRRHDRLIQAIKAREPCLSEWID